MLNLVPVFSSHGSGNLFRYFPVSKGRNSLLPHANFIIGVIRINISNIHNERSSSDGCRAVRDMKRK